MPLTKVNGDEEREAFKVKLRSQGYCFVEEYIETQFQFYRKNEIIGGDVGVNPPGPENVWVFSPFLDLSRLIPGASPNPIYLPEFDASGDTYDIVAFNQAQERVREHIQETLTPELIARLSVLSELTDRVPDRKREGVLG